VLRIPTIPCEATGRGDYLGGAPPMEPWNPCKEASSPNPLTLISPQTALTSSDSLYLVSYSHYPIIPLPKYRFNQRQPQSHIASMVMALPHLSLVLLLIPHRRAVNPRSVLRLPSSTSSKPHRLMAPSRQMMPSNSKSPRTASQKPSR
jgi:hypothetical protein